MTSAFGQSTSLFGKPTGTVQPFGSTATTSASIWAPGNTAPTASGIFGNKPVGMAQPFSFGGQTQTSTAGTLFGATQPSTSTSTGLFGGPTTAQTTLFGATGLFSKPATTTTSAFTFPSLPAPATAPGVGSMFNFNAPKPGNMGFTFGPPTTSQQGLGLMLPGTSTAGQQQSAAPQDPYDLYLDKLLLSMIQPVAFNDERDKVLAKFNQLQAFEGSGEGYYQTGAPPVDYSLKENPFCRFKTVCYSRLMGWRNSDGCVGLVINKPVEELGLNSRDNRKVAEALHRVLGGDMTLTVQVHGAKPLPGNKCEVVFYVLKAFEPGPQGKRRLPATDLAAGLESAQIKMQLQQQMHVECINLKYDMREEDLERYLEVPPPGMDPVIWSQAVKESPDPKKFIPVQILGFAGLTERHKLQVEQADYDVDRLRDLVTSVSEGQNRRLTMYNRLRHCFIRQQKLAHRHLQVQTQAYMNDNQGYSINANEEAWQGHLELVQTKLRAAHALTTTAAELVAQKSRLHKSPEDMRLASETLEKLTAIYDQANKQFSAIMNAWKEAQ